MLDQIIIKLYYIKKLCAEKIEVRRWIKYKIVKMRKITLD